MSILWADYVGYKEDDGIQMKDDRKMKGMLRIRGLGREWKGQLGWMDNLDLTLK